MVNLSFMRVFFSFLAIIISLSLFTKCENIKSSDKNPDFDISIQRFEKELFSINPDELSIEHLKDLNTKYPDFYPLYVENILMATEKFEDYEAYLDLIQDFIGNKAVRGLYDSVMHYYPKIDDIEKELSISLTLFKRNFPNSNIPQVVTFISEFAHGAVTYNDVLGIGIDLYLGEQYPYYSNFFPQFMMRRLSKEFMTINAMQVMATDLLPEPVQKNSLLDKMIFNGKILYFLEQTMPFKNKFDLIGYTEEQYKWCIENEPHIWAYFIEHNLLFNNVLFEHQKYVTDGPFTIGMPDGAPGKIAMWTGWQIVKAYMDKSSNTTLPQLFTEEDAHKILRVSKYKPKL